MPDQDNTSVFRRQREKMVADQLRSRDIVDERVLAVMADLPRELFLEESLRSQAYMDGPVPIGLGQTVSQPYIQALMTQNLHLKGSEKVLEIGTGSGYQTAILARLSREVYTVERLAELSAAARMVLETGTHPGALKDAVTSPGGTTIAGIHALESGGFRGTVMNAVEAATLRSRELGQA